MIALIITYIIGYIIMFSYLIIDDYNHTKKNFYKYEQHGNFKYDVSNITLEDFVGNAKLSIFWFCILQVLILRFLIKHYVNFLIKMYILIDDD